MPLFGPGGVLHRDDSLYIESCRLKPALKTPPEKHYVADANWTSIARKVLIKRNMGLGDVLMVTPLIRHLAELAIEVHIATEPLYMPLFEGNPYCAAVLDIHEVDTTPYIWVIDLCDYAEHPSNQLQHRVDAFASGCWVTLKSRELDYFPSPEDTAALPMLPDRFIAYGWASTTANRNWDVKTHKRILKSLIGAGHHVALLHTSEVAPGIDSDQLLNFSGKLTIRETAAVMAASTLVLAPDTGLFHLASALRKPVLTYFGAFPLGDRQTHGSVHLVNQPEKMPCFPCRDYRCIHQAGTVNCAPCIAPDEMLLLQRVREIFA